MTKKTILALALASIALLPAAAQQTNNADAPQSGQAKQYKPGLWPIKGQGMKRLSPQKTIERRAENMANRMMLDDKTKAKFLTVYKDYLTEQMAIDSAACPKQTRTVSDADVTERIERGFDTRQKQLDNDRKYYKKLSPILTARQLQQVFSSGNGNKPAFRYNPQTGRNGQPAVWKGKTPRLSRTQGQAGKAPAAKPKTQTND